MLCPNCGFLVVEGDYVPSVCFVRDCIGAPTERLFADNGKVIQLCVHHFQQFTKGGICV